MRFGLDKKDFQDWQNVLLEPIPQKILDIYDENISKNFIE
jgi:hypothetical protein